MSDRTVSTLYRNGRIFTADPDEERAWAQAFAVSGESIVWVGRADDAPAAERVVDLEGRLVLPGFTDAHTHLLMMGAALGQVYLTGARGLDDIHRMLRDARAADPGASALRGRGWLFDAVPGGTPTAAMIDAAISDIPVYLDANDYHSCWVNSAALAELGITRETPDPIGGEIVRDAEGVATGLLLDTAATQYAWAQRDAAATDEDRDADVERTIAAYVATGVTGAVDMALDEFGLAALRRAQERRGGELPIRVAAHWLVANTGDDADDAVVSAGGNVLDEALPIAPDADPAATDVTGVADPRLGALADNGGPTATLLPATGSPVIDAGLTFTDADMDAMGADVLLNADQRGVVRPLDGNGDGSARVDAGSVEAPAVAVTPAPTGGVTPPAKPVVAQPDYTG